MTLCETGEPLAVAPGGLLHRPQSYLSHETGSFIRRPYRGWRPAQTRV